MIIDSGGTPMTIIIRRFRCVKCGKIHHELPDMVIPYKRHSADTIERVLNRKMDGLDLELSTIGRIRVWWTGLRLYYESVLRSLREKYGVLISAKSAPREIVRAVCNAHLWPHTRSAFLTG